MRKYLLFVLGVSLLSFHPARAQEANQTVITAAKEAGALPHFDLDFPGGTPVELVSAIEKATGKSLNVVIGDGNKDWKMIPSFSVKNVTVAQLFEGLLALSLDIRYYPGGHKHEDLTGFRTSGVPQENSVWYFVRGDITAADRPNAPDVCRFYQLSPYLEAGYKVEDITTAIETGWEMLGANPQDAADSIKYHKDTKLLIVKGNAEDMKAIEDMLAQLSKVMPKHSKDAQKSKTP